MKRRTQLRRKKPLVADPDKVKAWRQRSRRRLPRINRRRRARLRAFQFGSKAPWVVAHGCYISGQSGTPDNPVDPAHIGKTPGAGADNSRILGLLRFPYHDDYDNLPREKFEAKHPVTHAELERAAAQLDEWWREGQAAQ